MPHRPLDVRRLLRAHTSPEGGPLVLVTPRDLALDGCESLFGYADRRRGVAIVSTFRLAGEGEHRLRERLDKVTAHERGHLAGLRHCATPGCAMQAVESTGQLDARTAVFCESCREGLPDPLPPARVRLFVPLRESYPLRRPGVAWGLSLLLCVAVLLALDLFARPVKVKQPPFSWRAEGGAAAVLYRREPVLRLAGADRARGLSERLNALYAGISPPPLTAEPAGTAARIRAGSDTLVELTPRDTAGNGPLAAAHAFSARIGPLLLAKGTAAEGCPDCHVRRRAEVEEAVRRRATRR